MFVWLLAGAHLSWEKNIIDWLLVTDLLLEKSTTDWSLISQANRWENIDKNSPLNHILVK
jgi:hypothetical protein